MILMLSVADAFLTLTLLTVGATEANPFLAYILEEHPKLFAAVKMGLTGVGVVVLVAVARAPLFRVMRAGTVMHWLLVGYVALIIYEIRLLHSVL
jgi:mannose/fructose/N-acetylgalactosamine-specific phosphotransferase system component IIC